MNTHHVPTIVNQQVTAMRSDRFEIGVLAIGGDKSGVMRTWGADTLMQSLGWLKAQNARGLNINIRPTANHLSLIDDVTLDQVGTMRSSGFDPCVVVQTSPNNYQAWLDHGQELVEEDATHAAQYLARKFQSDYSAAGRRHFGRLAGFTNRKEKHRRPDGLYPFVRLEHAQPGPYKASSGFLDELRVYQASIRPTTAPKAFYAPPSAGKAVKSVDDFRLDTYRYPKLHNADLAYAVYAVSHGVTEREIRDAVASRDLTHKGPRRAQLAYIQRTVRKAYRDANHT